MSAGRCGHGTLSPVPEAARIGPTYLGGGKCEFLVWAPLCKGISIRVFGATERIIPVEKGPKGYWHALADGVLPGGLRMLINECHRRGLAVILDVVYNHLGPEGNYLSTYGPYFTDRYSSSSGWEGPGSVAREVITAEREGFQWR